jgi:hypothetical protein
MVIGVLRRFGRPEDVAARYAPRGFELIEPQIAPWFMRLAVAGVVLQWALTLPRVFAADVSIGDWWTKWSVNALAWVGLLVIWFALATWVRRLRPVSPDARQRHWSHYFFWVPSTTDWRPIDREATERRAAKGALPLAILTLLFFIAPAWFVGMFAWAGANPTWVVYDPGFQRWLLLPILALMAARMGLFVAARNERWRAPTAGLRFALWVAFVALLYWALFGWSIFANRLSDALFKTWLLVFLVVNTIQIIVWIRRETTRVRLPASLANPKQPR